MLEDGSECGPDLDTGDSNMAHTGWMDVLKERLDKDQPHWYINWADQRELQSYAFEMKAGENSEWAVKQLRASVANRLFHRILNAAEAAGIVKGV
jgi:hypothetical protein